MTTVCPLCSGTGRVLVLDFDGKTFHPCDCTVGDYRRALARRFGTDAERRRITDDAKRRPMAPPRQPS